MALQKTTFNIPGYEKVVSAEDPSRGLSAIIAIHSTHLGPSCGGIRLLPYRSRDEALTDVLRLSKGMSYKSAVAELGFGGGKSVIISDPKDKRPEVFHAFGEFVDSFAGKYIAAKDMNITSGDLLEVQKKTRHVLGIEGVDGSSGDPSPITAIGCFEAFRAVWKFLSRTDSLKGVRIALQGLGHVGYDLAKRIVGAGGRLIVSDINAAVLERAKRELNAEICDNESIHSVACDIFSPCARGAVLNRKSIQELRCRAVAGCANNQLAEPQDGFQIWERGIVYAPDFVVNAGGIINIFVEFEGYDKEKAVSRAKAIYGTLTEILERSHREKIPTFVIADKMAEERLHG